MVLGVKKRKLTEDNQINLKPKQEKNFIPERNYQFPILKPKKITNPEYQKL